MCTPLLMPASDGCYSTSSLNITAMVGKYKMHRIFIDTGSSSDILYEHAFRKMSWEDQQLMEWVDYPVMGFSGEMNKPMGKINLPLIIGEGKKQRKVNLTFLIIKAETKHNVILGRVALGLLAAWVSTAQGMMVFPTLGGQMCIKAEEQCAIAEKWAPTMPKEVRLMADEKWVLNPNHPEQMITLGKELSENVRNHLKNLLREYADVFAFQHSDMTGIPRKIIEHQLKIHPNKKPIVVAHVDSLLVSNQINGVYEIKEERMKQYVQVVEGLMAKFESCVVIHVPRSQNKKADALSKLASSFADPVKEISVEEVLVPTTEVKMINVIQEDR
ncbi:hypothetical protein E3N88_39659 [Mikania micrantha]|uniref:RNase H type-1 domain-containing protein n=1 Tax=Mikania micrantha TaxID=192012 RepID=A0A5N6M027_9ASTR|nr:hypothetical protein E3N88_39659 [Mikania micrantha]